VRKYVEYADEARSLTTGLCILLAVAVLGTIVVSALAVAGVAVFGSYAHLSATTNIRMPFAHWQQMYLDRLRDAAILITLLVVGTAIFKSFMLAEGGGKSVARSMGGTRVGELDADPDRRRLRNIAEELAIATGLRTPPVYVLEEEPAINAFAAGFGGEDAVVGVTRGAVDRLKRNQLQGVVAHEFSHIINGDMRLNIRLLGFLTGIQAITFIAQYLLRLGMPVLTASNGKSSSRRHPLGMILALVFGVVLWPIGQIGALFALLITSAVNRQREFLADASAVQYTRDPEGLREALIVLLQDECGGSLHGAAAQVASHMFFVGGMGWHQLIATHPPLEERIRRLDSTDGSLRPQISRLEAALPNSSTPG
jgi:Zn-dependent protease with chaperone function